MISKSLLKYVQSLHSRKNRQKYDKFIAQGPKIANEILTSSNLTVEFIFGTTTYIEKNQDLLKNYKSKVNLVTEKELERISTNKTPNEVILVCDKLVESPKVLLNDGWTFYLDKVQDPGNVGTIIRIADWFGVQNVVLGPECADLYNPKVLQSTMGGFMRVNITKLDFEALVTANQGKNIYAAALDGQSIKELTLDPGIIVIGNESKGIQKSILDASDVLLHIPSGGGAESLNAAVACGIIAYSLILQ